VIGSFPLPLSPSRQGREDCKQDLSVHFLLSHCEARSAKAIWGKGANYQIAALRSQ